MIKREVHGVLNVPPLIESDALKRLSLVFDMLQLCTHVDYRMLDRVTACPAGQSDYDRSALEFLYSRGYIGFYNMDENENDTYFAWYSDLLHPDHDHLKRQTEYPNPENINKELVSDIVVRTIASDFSNKPNIEAVPICKHPLPESFLRAYPNETKVTSTTQVLRLAIDAIPMPGESSSWEDILNFRSEKENKLWDFHRFLNELATKNQTEAEIRDDIEWTVNEHSKAMALHRLKARQGAIDIFVITPIEIIENLLKFNWTKIAKGALQVNKRKVELMEAELRAPGKECAYVFDARERFGPK